MKDDKMQTETESA